MTLPSRIGGPTTKEVGFFDTDHRGLAAWLLNGLGHPWRMGPAGWHSITDAIRALVPTAPVSRYACVAVNAWTLILDNGPRGTDVGILPSHAARELRCRAIRAVCVDDDGPGYPARILTVYGPDGQPPLRIERSIAAANDGGRWVFETSGQPFAFEDLVAYQARRKSERFSSEMLYRYLRALDVPIDSEPDWGSAVLIELNPTGGAPS